MKDICGWSCRWRDLVQNSTGVEEEKEEGERKRKETGDEERQQKVDEEWKRMKSERGKGGRRRLKRPRILKYNLH